MSPSHAKNVKKLLRSAINDTTSSLSKARDLIRSAVGNNTTTSSTAAATKDENLKHHISSSKTTDSSSLEPSKLKSSSSSKPLSELAVESIRVDNPGSLLDSSGVLSRKISSILCGDSAESEETDDEQPLRYLLELPWFPILSHNGISLRRKEVARERKQKWNFKSTQGNRFQRLVRMCTQKLGADAAIHVFGKLGRETGVKEFNALIHQCIERARDTDDEDVALEEFYKAYQVFETMRERGFQIGEETYGPFLMFIIDLGMVEEFHFFCDNIKKENPKSLPRLAYYEMLLWTRVGDEDKIQMLVANADNSGGSSFLESYLVALCEGDRKEEVSMLLEMIDIKKVSSLHSKESIFKSLGRLLLESYAKKFILELKTDDDGGQDLSKLIYSYVISLPNILIEDGFVKFKNMLAELKVASSLVPCKMLIKTCCESLEVYLALDVVDWMFEEGLSVEIDTFNSILTACHGSCEYNLVHRIYSMIKRHNLTPNSETFRGMISLFVKMKDFEGAYGMLKDLEELNLLPTANIYNTIMGGFFREKNFGKGLMVLKQMEAADVKPDSQTFSFIIGNCNSEDDIVKYHQELRESGVQPTKHVYMALINAYAACGLFDKAKQIVFDKGVPVKNLNEIKSVLVSALASHGQITDALDMYDEVIKAEANVEPKAILCLIENLQFEGELSRLLQLLEQLKDTDLWDEGCARIILFCVRHKLLSPAVDLLKKRMDKFCSNEMAIEVLFDEVFCQVAETEPTDVQFGLDLLNAIKEDLGIRPSRRSLDFLLSACVKVKDLERSLSVWKEYQTAGLPYNVLSFVRMYQALLASGAHKAAKIMLENIPHDDPHVSYVVKASQRTFCDLASVERTFCDLPCVESKEKKEKKKNKKKKNKKKGKVEV